MWTNKLLAGRATGPVLTALAIAGLLILEASTTLAAEEEQERIPAPDAALQTESVAPLPSPEQIEEKSEEQKPPVAEPTTVNPQPAPAPRNAGISLFTGHGAMIPVADYGDLYDTGYALTLGTRLYRYNFHGICPGIHLRYNYYDSKPDPRRYSSRFDILQITPAICYFYEIGLPASKIAFFNGKPLTFFTYIADGVSGLFFKTEYEPRTTEWLNTFEIGAGVTYPLYRMLEAGVSLSYRLISTAEVPMHAVEVNFLLGVRL